VGYGHRFTSSLRFAATEREQPERDLSARPRLFLLWRGISIIHFQSSQRVAPERLQAAMRRVVLSEAAEGAIFVPLARAPKRITDPLSTGVCDILSSLPPPLGSPIRFVHSLRDPPERSFSLARSVDNYQLSARYNRLFVNNRRHLSWNTRNAPSPPHVLPLARACPAPWQGRVPADCDPRFSRPRAPTCRPTRRARLSTSPA